MNNKNEYMLLAKNIQTIINNLNDLNTNFDDLTKNFNKGLDGEQSNTSEITKIHDDLKTIIDDLNGKVLPELKKITK